jgi:PEGA domain
MTRSLIRSSVVVALLAMLFIAFAPLSVLAQRGGGGGGGARGGGGGSAGQARPAGPGPGPGGGTATARPGPGGPGVTHGNVVVAGGYPYRYGYGYGYPYRYCCGYPYGWYSPWFGYGGWGWNFGFSYGWGYPYPYAFAGYPYAFGYPYGPYGYGFPYSGYGFYGGASLKLEVTPKTAEVFVDGYRAGIVDDFDGTFQHLEVPPGEHELVLYSDGYRTVQQKLFMSASSNQRVKYALEKLAPGETSGPRPTPPPEPAPEQQQAQPQQLQPHRAQPQQPPPDPAQAPESFGMISIRTQPVDAEILVDGEKWERSTGTSRLVIQLGPGRHRVEVRKAGFTTYSEEVLIRAGATMTLNVSLLHGEER